MNFDVREIRRRYDADGITVNPKASTEEDCFYNKRILGSCPLKYDVEIWGVSEFGMHILAGMSSMPAIEKVIFNYPATIVKWADGTKTVVKCQRDDCFDYEPRVGLLYCIAKKAYGNKGNFNDVINEAIEGAME